MLRFENVTYTYPFQPAPAVQDINIAVQPGELVLCTGASGCGKSTLIRLANGLCPHYYQGQLQGTVYLGGQSTHSQSLAELARQGGTLFQDPEQQFFALTVEDELAFALEWQGLPRPDMHRTVDTVTQGFGLTSLLPSALHHLSEGQKQKVGLAALCAQKPRALILDEPSANLDPEATAALAQHLAHLKAQGMAILVVDHRLYWLEGIADRVLVMEKGRVAAQGSFDLLHHADVRTRYGLRAAQVADVRHTLPDCRLAQESVVAVQGLHFAHKGQEALYTDAHFTLPAGITALVGDNGCGKTTLARLLAGLCAPTAEADKSSGKNSPCHCGTILVDGTASDAKHRLRRTGIVLQNADHQLHMRTVLQEVQTSLELADKLTDGLAGKLANERADTTVKSQEKALHILSLFDLAPLAERHPQSLSGGEKQRLVIACALAKNPRLLILDEPTSGLDGGNMARLGAVLQSCAQKGMCVALITHDLELLQGLCGHALRLPLQALPAPHPTTPITPHITGEYHA